ncbi:MAG: aromatic ring-hydroxylating oxygenase subunit alpha, partial [Acidimicrobiia bacterium]
MWLLLGRASHMPEPGDYQMEEVGPESFLMVRQHDRTIRTFYNVCQHRGSRLTFAPEGSTSQFVCPYHSWSYGLDGSLLEVQDPEDFAGGDPCEHLRLVEVATEEFAGFVWINMAPEPEPLRAFLGPLWDEWAAYQCEPWTRVTALTARVKCNWKVIQDNFCESYHLPTVHPQLMESHEESYRHTDFQMSRQGHNRMIMLGAMPSVTQYGESPPLPDVLRSRLADWSLDPEDFVDSPLDVRAALQEQMRALGPGRGHHHYEQLRDQQLTDSHHYNLFPNCSLTFAADGLLMQRMRPHPTDPEQCLFDHWYYAFTPAVSGDGVAAGATNIRLDGLE